MCDNFDSGAVDAAVDSIATKNIASYVSTAENSVETLLATSPPHNFPKEKLMVEELEKEYAVLKDKVRELREYL